MATATSTAPTQTGLAATAPTVSSERPRGDSPRSLSGLLPYLRPYRGRIALALLDLVMAAVSTLVLPLALRSLIDQGLIATDPGQRVLALRGYILALFGVGAALGIFSALRFYLVSRLSTSPVAVVSKNAGLCRSTCA